MNNDYVEWNSGKYVVRSGPSGFIDRLLADDTVILDAASKPGFSGIELTAFLPENNTELFPVVGRSESALVTHIQRDMDDGLGIKVTARAGPLKAQYEIDISREAGLFSVNMSVSLEGKGWLSSLGAALPLNLCADPMKRRTSVGGENRVESWRVDQNDEDTSEAWLQKVSDTKARWPRWRLGGLCVDAKDQYVIWKSNGIDTPALVMERGAESPGWISYSDTAFEITLCWSSIRDSYPAGFTVDGESGIMWVWLHPPSARPLRITEPLQRSAQLTMDVRAETDPS